MPTKPHGRNYVDSVLGIIFGVVLLAPLALAQRPELKTGPNADLGGALLMPANDEWNRDVSKDPVDPRSDAIIASIGAAPPGDKRRIWGDSSGGQCIYG
jgi:hypothetical protein